MDDCELFFWIVRGAQRVAILRAFSAPMTPSQLRKSCLSYNKKVSLNNTSDVIRKFEAKGIAVCLAPNNKIDRIYSLTDIGEEIRQILLKVFEHYNHHIQ